MQARRRAWWAGGASGLVFAAIVLAAACGGGSSSERLPDGVLTFRTSAGTRTLDVEIARTPEARARGLMGRTRLDPHAGMAFLFEAPTTSAFWMKDTVIPLSIAFWDGEGRILSILDMDPCRSDPCPRYRPDAPYVGAVEANMGFFATNGIRAGDEVILDEV